MSASPSAHGAPDGVLLRLAVHEDAWAEDLPPVPDGFTVTVSFASDDAADLHGPAVELLGYRIAGVATALGARDCADVVVPSALARRHPGWWAAITACGGRVYDLGFGPVAAALDPVLALHHGAADRLLPG